MFTKCLGSHKGVERHQFYIYTHIYILMSPKGHEEASNAILPCPCPKTTASTICAIWNVGLMIYLLHLLGHNNNFEDRFSYYIHVERRHPHQPILPRCFQTAQPPHVEAEVKPCTMQVRRKSNNEDVTGKIQIRPVCIYKEKRI